MEIKGSYYFSSDEVNPAISVILRKKRILKTGLLLLQLPHRYCYFYFHTAFESRTHTQCSPPDNNDYIAYPIDECHVGVIVFILLCSIRSLSDTDECVVGVIMFILLCSIRSLSLTLTNMLLV